MRNMWLGREFVEAGLPPLIIYFIRIFLYYLYFTVFNFFYRDGFGLGETRDLPGYSRYRLIGSDEESK